MKYSQVCVSHVAVEANAINLALFMSFLLERHWYKIADVFMCPVCSETKINVVYWLVIFVDKVFFVISTSQLAQKNKVWLSPLPRARKKKILLCLPSFSHLNRLRPCLPDRQLLPALVPLSVSQAVDDSRAFWKPASEALAIAQIENHPPMCLCWVLPVYSQGTSSLFQNPILFCV